MYIQCICMYIILYLSLYITIHLRTICGWKSSPCVFVFRLVTNAFVVFIKFDINIFYQQINTHSSNLNIPETLLGASASSPSALSGWTGIPIGSQLVCVCNLMFVRLAWSVDLLLGLWHCLRTHRHLFEQSSSLVFATSTQHAAHQKQDKRQRKQWTCKPNSDRKCPCANQWARHPRHICKYACYMYININLFM